MSERDTNTYGKGNGNGKSIRVEHASIGLGSIAGLALLVGGYFVSHALEDLAAVTRDVAVLKSRVDTLERESSRREGGK